MQYIWKYIFIYKWSHKIMSKIRLTKLKWYSLILGIENFKYQNQRNFNFVKLDCNNFNFVGALYSHLYIWYICLFCMPSSVAIYQERIWPLVFFSNPINIYTRFWLYKNKATHRVHTLAACMHTYQVYYKYLDLG